MEEPTPISDDAKQLLRRLLDDNDLPQPDEILPHEDGILCLWHEPKVAVVIEFEEGRKEPRDATRQP
jgi:hypothetical protein